MTTTPDYRETYNRGWSASRRGSGLEAADMRGEPDAWYDGYLDFAAGREKWHLSTCAATGGCPAHPQAVSSR